MIDRSQSSGTIKINFFFLSPCRSEQNTEMQNVFNLDHGVVNVVSK